MRFLRSARGAATAGSLGVLLLACGTAAEDVGPQAAPTTATTSVTSEAPGTGAAPVAQALDVVGAVSATVDAFSPPGPAIEKVERAAGATVHYIPVSLESSTYAAVAESLAEALAHADVAVLTCDGKSDPERIRACMTEAVEADADVIVTGGVTEDVAGPAFIHADRARIPVLLTQTTRTGRGRADEMAYLTPGYAEMQAWTASWVVADSGGAAGVLAVKLLTVPAAGRWMEDGALATYATCPGCSVTVLETTTGEAGGLADRVREALTQDPAISYVHVAFDAAVGPVLDGIESAGRPDVRLVSQDGELAVMRELSEGRTVAAVAGFDHYAFGWYAADQTLRLLSGGESLRDVDFPYRRLFTAKEVTQLELTEGEARTGRWYGETAYQEGFLELWGVADR